MTSKRIWWGLAVTVVFTTVASELVSAGSLVIDPVIESIVLSFFGVALGAFVARRGFVLPAVAFWFLGWTVGLYLVYRIAEPLGQASIFGILQSNALGIALSLVATIAGALVGQQMAQHIRRPVPAT